MITLTEDVTLDEVVYFYEDTTIDLAGHKLSGLENDYLFRLDKKEGTGDDDPTLTIDDSVGGATVEGWKLFYTLADCSVIVNGGTYTCTDGGKIANLKSGSMTVNDGDFTCLGSANGVELYNDLYSNNSGAIGAVFTMNGGSISCDSGHAVSTNNLQSGGSEATITGGELKSENYIAIYWPSEGNLTIEDGKITGSTGIDIKMGKLTVKGGEITGTGTKVDDWQESYTGPLDDGAAIRIDGQEYGNMGIQYIESDELVVTISGGTFYSVNGHAISIFDVETATEEKVSIDISGGTFESADGEDPVYFFAKDETSANSGEYNMSVSVSGGTYSAPFHGSMLSEDALSVRYGGTVYVGTGEEVSEAITRAATEAGDENVEITIIAGSGNLYFTDFYVTVALSKKYGYKDDEITVNSISINDETANESIEAHEHSVSDWTWADGIEANCGTDGTRAGICDVCGATVTEEVKATGEHVWNDGEVTIEPTATEDGEMTYTCEVCGETVTEPIAGALTAPDDAPSGEGKTYEKSLSWTAGLSAGAGVAVACGLIFTGVGCDTRKRKRDE